MAAEPISVFFKNAGVPATGLSPTLDARLPDGTLALNSVAMIEIGGGWYTYSFVGYDKTKTYYFVADGGATLDDADRYVGNVNELDAYQNKGDWRGNVILQPDVIARQILEAKIKYEAEEGTLGKLLSDGLSDNARAETMSLIDQIREELKPIKEKIDELSDFDTELLEERLDELMTVSQTTLEGQSTLETLTSGLPEELRAKFESMKNDFQPFQDSINVIVQTNNLILPVLQKLEQSYTNLNFGGLTRAINELPSLVQEYKPIIESTNLIPNLLDQYSKILEKLTNKDEADLKTLLNEVMKSALLLEDIYKKIK